MALSKKEKRARDFSEEAFANHKNSDWPKTADRLKKAIKGEYKKGFDPIRSRVVVNKAYNLVNLILPHFILNNPYIDVVADNSVWLKKIREGEYSQLDAIRMSRNMEAVINEHIKVGGQIFEDRKAIQDSMVYPFGLTKDGYSFDTISEGGKDYIVKDGGYHSRVNPRDFGWHPMATCIEDSPWLVHRVTMTKEKAEARGYKTKNLEPGIPEYQKTDKNLGSKNAKTFEEDYYQFYEVLHQDGDMIYLFGGSNYELLDKKKREDVFYNIITFTKDNDEFEGIPMLKMIEPQLWLLNEFLSLMIQHIRKFPGQMFLNKEAVADDDVKEQILNGEQGSQFVVDDINGILRTSPLMFGQEYFQVFNLINAIIDQTLGIPDFKTLVGNPSRVSATAASFIQGDSNVRKNYFKNIVKEFVLKGVKNQAHFKQKHQDEKEYIQATGSLQKEYFVVNKKDYPEEYIYDLDIDEMGAANEAELNNINNILATFSKSEFLAPSLGELDSKKFRKKIFSLAKLNDDAFSKKGVEEGIVYTPEKENEMLLAFPESGVPMPRPNRNENTDAHLESHKKILQDLIKEKGELSQQDPVVNMLIEHIAETEMIANPQMAQQGDVANPQMQNQQQVMQPAGPRGPLRGPPQ